MKAVIAAVAALALVGCVKRTEVMVVMPDRAVRLVTLFEGDADDVHSGDAAPSVESGWQVTERTQKDDDGKEELVLTARMNVPTGGRLPETYAPGGTPLEDVALRFPTSITVEQRDDGTYYHFRRTYAARPFAFVQHWRNQTLEEDSIKALTEKDPATLTDEERVQLAEAFLRFEMEKAAALLDEGFAAVDGVPQDAWLTARAKVRAVYQAKDLASRVVALMQEVEPDADALADLEDEVQADAAEAIRTALTDARVPPATLRTVQESLERARTSFGITEDLGDDQVWLFVALPGKIVAHNATEEVVSLKSAVEDMDGDEDAASELLLETAELNLPAGFEVAAWDIRGDALRDRDVVVAATSFVPKSR